MSLCDQYLTKLRIFDAKELSPIAVFNLEGTYLRHVCFARTIKSRQEIHNGVGVYVDNSKGRKILTELLGVYWGSAGVRQFREDIGADKIENA